MESLATMTTEHSSSLKRPRSPTEHNPLPAAKVPRTATNHLQINYLARQHKETIPLVTVNDKLPEIARLLSEYDGVIQRHESMAGNLGACPLGPILLKRFERLFDGPPKVLKSHAKDSNVTWLDVVEFAQNNPKQFNLERTRNGVRVCQFYTKQCRVEISEEDFVLIASGMPQKLIPPQPILEDEEKELGVMDLLDRNLGQVIQLADQVSGRARQLIHKMKNRRTAILSRREQEVESLRRNNLAPEGPSMSPAETNGIHTGKPLKSIEVSQSPPVGFTAVNLKPPGAAVSESRPSLDAADGVRRQGEDTYGTPNAGNVTIINGKSVKDASPSVRAEMMKKFLTPGEREAGLDEDAVRRSSVGTARTNAMQAASAEKARSGSIEDPSGGAPGGRNPPSVAIPSTPASLIPHVKPSTFERDDGGPFKAEMVRRMDSMWKGERIVPPCDRCRRLHMDCLKNLTACMGCTKKHAKCSWKEVKAHELQMSAQSPSPDRDVATASGPDTTNIPPLSADSTIEVSQPSDQSAGSASIARASLDLAGESSDAVMDRGTRDFEARRPSEPILMRTSSARFDVRPPPLTQQLQDAAEGRVPAGPNTVPSSVPPGGKRYFEDNDEEDRLEALAARVFRTASQSGHRSS
ncbi:hypothetical protein A1O1_07275 [Capronia coronata CBS 617.96]|uniref:Zn(2)-C6 fungal-type domain-containing protein n=1 Tax=Capronia coronata CBS 617.96 TaxID=1182541 RepID=W9Y328_9EURO|nr:uncharacterized protein A1O1_07275 [Capronia coronata CBS 617.96]EXJ83651.1 hypothetical protein A1O1_07275 [Capronia coronata CBS 617.96]